ncbi:MAG: hypothetical protein FGM50_09145 [Mycobacterium sp.]|nr:hypothetical protein [Mycobacterium sp.]
MATLAKYAGISFVAGAVNHGFFSERRSFVTAGVGVVCFLIGAAMEMKAAPDGSKRWGDLLGFGIIASIGLGFFTGGLQHFPDSPGRSLWVVPLGFFLSLGAVYLSEGRGRIAPKPLAAYTLAAGATVLVGSAVAASYWGQLGGDGHDHDHAAVTAAAPTAAAPPSPGAVRNVVVEVDDAKRITPANWQAKQGETVRLIVVNTGQTKHELAVGPAQEVAAHAESMKSSGSHGHDNGVAVEPGQTATLLYTFEQPGVWGIACLEPGHYDSGMAGSVNVSPST